MNVLELPRSFRHELAAATPHTATCSCGLVLRAASYPAAYTAHSAHAVAVLSHGIPPATEGAHQ